MHRWLLYVFDFLSPIGEFMASIHTYWQELRSLYCGWSITNKQNEINIISGFNSKPLLTFSLVFQVIAKYSELQDKKGKEDDDDDDEEEEFNDEEEKIMYKKRSTEAGSSRATKDIHAVFDSKDDGEG